MATGDARREDWSAALSARRELGDEYDQAFVENFVDRVSAEIDSRVDMRVAQMASTRPVATRRRRGSSFLALASIVLGIPLTQVAGNTGHTAGLAIAWGGIVLVNVANSWRPVWPRSHVTMRPPR
jgi:hypothetical protein